LTFIPLVREFSGVRCIGFEPEPRNYAYLMRNLEMNCPAAMNAELHNLALTDKEGTLPMAVSTTNSGNHQLAINATVTSLTTSTGASCKSRLRD
jgi:FkbM family methyltransferase